MAKDKTFTCDRCAQEFPKEKENEMEGMKYCNDCLFILIEHGDC